jgi:hypothetical protein
LGIFDEDKLLETRMPRELTTFRFREMDIAYNSRCGTFTDGKIKLTLIILPQCLNQPRTAVAILLVYFYNSPVVISHVDYRSGLGWFVREDEFGYPVVKHSGSMQGTNTILKMIPSENIAVVALFNANTGLRTTIANDIIGELLPDYGDQRQLFLPLNDN